MDKNSKSLLQNDKNFAQKDFISNLLLFFVIFFFNSFHPLLFLRLNYLNTYFLYLFIII